jgi:hypothetical protein
LADPFDGVPILGLELDVPETLQKAPKAVRSGSAFLAPKGDALASLTASIRRQKGHQYFLPH